MIPEVLGIPLHEALARFASAGLQTPRVMEISAPPKHPPLSPAMEEEARRRAAEEPRVVRVSPDRSMLTVCRFLTGDPKKREENAK